MYLEKPIEELMKLIEESGYSTYASWKIQHEMEEAKRLYYRNRQGCFYS